MAAPILLKIKTATYKTVAILHVQTADISVEGSEQTTRGDGAAAMQFAYVEGVHMRVSVTALESAIATADLTWPANGSLVLVAFQQAPGSGAAAASDKTFTFTNATHRGVRRGMPLDGQPTVVHDFVVVATTGVVTDLMTVT